MKWILALSISAALLVFAAIIAAVLHRDRRATVRPYSVVIVAVFLALAVMVFPFGGGDDSAEGIILKIPLSILSSLQIFGLNGEFSAAAGHMDGVPSPVTWVYLILMALLYIAAPLMTAGLVASLFGRADSALKWVFASKRKVFVFTEVCERSLLLAESAGGDGKAPLFLFCGEIPQSGSQGCRSRLTALRAIHFDMGIDLMKPSMFRKVGELSVFFSAEDESDNLSSAVVFINENRELRNARLYIFTTSPEAEQVLNSVDTGRLAVRRINEVRLLTYEALRTRPVFDGAVERNGVKHISVLIAGMGSYGEEMLKALVWSTIREGYYLTVNVIDREPFAGRLRAACPELFSDDLPDAADIRYKINTLEGVDLFAFEPETMPVKYRLKDTSFVFTSLGSSDRNAASSIYLREKFGRMGLEPRIMSVSYTTDRFPATDFKNYKGVEYGIELIGLRRGIYTVDAVTNSRLEEMAREMHRFWCGGADASPEEIAKFDSYEYFYMNSISSILFWDMRREAGLDCEETEQNMKLEHCRWNAYMRTQGYVRGPRNDLYKTHNCLVSWNELDSGKRQLDAGPMHMMKGGKADDLYT